MEKEDYMRECLKEAKKCASSHDVPVGAIIVRDGEIISKAHNSREKLNETCAHAEIVAIQKANKKLKSSRLDGMEIYVSKEPCLMCMGAILSARIKKIYFGAWDMRFGTEELALNNKFNHKCEIEGGILKEECEKILTNFFRGLRNNESIRKG